MTLSVNGQSRVPPGFRFHPTEEELLYYYLKKKVSFEKIDLDVIRDVDLNKLEPWDLQERCKIGSTPQTDWYFFSHKDKKYPTGTRTNRATAAGFWKATGRDKAIHMNFKRIGMRKTLVFYKGRAPHGQKTDWIMHEYRLEDNDSNVIPTQAFNDLQEDGWVVCRVFKKRNHFKATDAAEYPPHSHAKKRIHTELECSATEADEISMQLNNNSNNLCKQEVDVQFGFSSQEQFMQLPHLESPKFLIPPASSSCVKRIVLDRLPESVAKRGYGAVEMAEMEGGSTVSNMNMQDWAVLERLVASHLNQEEAACKDDIRFAGRADASGEVRTNRLHTHPHDFSSEIDLWNFGK